MAGRTPGARSTGRSRSGGLWIGPPWETPPERGARGRDRSRPRLRHRRAPDDAALHRAARRDAGARLAARRRLRLGRARDRGRAARLRPGAGGRRRPGRGRDDARQRGAPTASRSTRSCSMRLREPLPRGRRRGRERPARAGRGDPRAARRPARRSRPATSPATGPRAPRLERASTGASWTVGGRRLVRDADARNRLPNRPSKLMGSHGDVLDALPRLQGLVRRRAGDPRAPARATVTPRSPSGGEIQVVNTCCVTHEAVSKSRQAASRAARTARTVYVTGCASRLERGVRRRCRPTSSSRGAPATTPRPSSPATSARSAASTPSTASTGFARSCGSRTAARSPARSA